MKGVLLLFLLLLTSFSYGQSVVWEKKFDDGQVHDIIRKTTDSSFIVSGASNITGFYPAHIVKYNWNGIVLWQTAVPGLDTGEQDIVQTADGGYLFAGAKRITPPNNNSDIILRKLDNAGNFQWDTTIYTPDSDIPTQILNSSTNGCYILGITGSSTANYFLRKTDSLGATVWFNQFTYTPNGYSASMIQNSYGNLILSGHSTKDALNLHPFLMEVDQQGDTVRTRSIVVQGTANHERIYRIYNNIIHTTDGGYAFSGFIDSSSYRIGFVVKVDSAFEKQWVFLQPNPPAKNQTISKVSQMSDGTFLLLSNEENPATSKIIITRISSTGQFVAKYMLHTSWCSKVRMYDWEFLPDSSVVVVGGCLDTPLKAYMAKVSGVGIPAIPPAPLPPDTLTTALPQLPHQAKATLGQSYPNPANTEAAIPFTLPADIGVATIIIHDLVRGTRLQEYRLEATAGKGLVKVNLQNLSSGVYLYTLVVDGRQVKTEKMVMVK